MHGCPVFFPPVFFPVFSFIQNELGSLQLSSLIEINFYNLTGLIWHENIAPFKNVSYFINSLFFVPK